MALREKSFTRDAAHQTATNILQGHLPQDPTIAFVVMHVRGLVLRLLRAQLNLQEILSMVHNILTSFPSADQRVLCDTFELLCRGVAGVLRREGTQTSLSPQLIQDTRRLVCNVTLALVEQGGYFVEGLAPSILVLSCADFPLNRKTPSLHSWPKCTRTDYAFRSTLKTRSMWH